MAVEIEHKYLVKDNGFLEMQTDQLEISQGYLCSDPERTVRVRIRNNKSYLTIKGRTNGAARNEYEYEIPISDAREMLKMCKPNVIRKIRHIVPFRGHIWEIDEFLDDLYPLIIAEIELKENNEQYDLPEFIGKNVTGDPQYYNSNLSQVKSNTY